MLAEACLPPPASPPWANVAVVWTAVGTLVFVVGYAWSTRGSWRATVMGRHVMTFMAVILVVSSLAVAGIVWGYDWPYRDVIRTVAWGAVGACIWWRVLLLYRVQHDRGDDAED